MEDCEALVTLADDPDIAATTLTIPHPYTKDFARHYLIEDEVPEPGIFNFAIAFRESDELAGSINCRVDTRHCSAELGFWMGRPFWGCGLCTEAVKAIVHYGFTTLALNRIHAAHLGENIASGRVLAKCAMKKEGCLRQAVWKDGKYHDLIEYGILREDYHDW
jgi:[ribosomal protein S5]-alanine N-acetyltransferase